MRSLRQICSPLTNPFQDHHSCTWGARPKLLPVLHFQTWGASNEPQLPYTSSSKTCAVTHLHGAQVLHHQHGAHLQAAISHQHGAHLQALCHCSPTWGAIFALLPIQHGAQSLRYCPSNMGRNLCAIAHPFIQFISVRVTAPMSMTLKNVSLTSVIIDGAY